MHFGQLKFFVILFVAVNNHADALSIDLEIAYNVSKKLNLQILDLQIMRVDCIFT